MSFIRTIAPADARGPVAQMFEEGQAEYGYVPNWMRAFSLRPGIRDGWNALLGSIKANLPLRTYELATLASARAIRNSYCSLAHGCVLADQVFSPAAVTAIATGGGDSPLEPRERALMAFAEKVALQAHATTRADIEGLRSHGYKDEEIFDIAAAAAARCFMSKLMDSMGVQPDASYRKLDPAMRDALTVGRPIAESAE
jgi:uncharacterized peroxidase-related enzyme